MEKVKLCPCYNPDTGYCGSCRRAMADMRHVFHGQMNPKILCDYDKDHDKMDYCPYYGKA